MIKSNSSEQNNCGGAPPSSCIQWQGGNIDCLNIENGDMLDETITTLATEICTLKETLDLTDIQLDCLFNICVSCPQPEKTLSVILQLLIDKVCTLEQAIADINTSTSTGSDPLVTLTSCFQYTNTDGDVVLELPLSSYVKQIATQVCSLKLSVSSLESDVSTIQDDINDIRQDITDLQNATGDTVTSDCVFSGTKDVPTAFELLDQAFCQIRTVLGITTQINGAISQQCDDLNTTYSATTGWNLTPSTLAQSVQNMWIVMCDLLTRVAANEACCAADCDDVKVGFSVVLSEDGTSLVISFTSGNGTSIPTGFADEGSVLTATDSLGNVEEWNVTIANNAQITLAVTSLDLSAGDLVFDLQVKIGDGSTHCEKCVTKTVKLSQLCKYCEITAIGDEGATAVIIYDDRGVNGVVISTPASETTTTTTTSSTTTTTTTTAP